MLAPTLWKEEPASGEGQTRRTPDLESGSHGEGWAKGIIQSDNSQH